MVMNMMTYKMTGLELFGAKLSSVFGWTGSSIAALYGIAGLFGFVDGLENVPTEFGIVLPLFFILLSGLFRYLEHRLKLREHKLKVNESIVTNAIREGEARQVRERHEAAMRLVKNMIDGKIEYDKEFVTKFLDADK